MHDSNRDFLKVIGLSKSFVNFKAVRNIGFNLSDGEFLGILGESGCGKTTLLRLLAGFEVPENGTVVLRGDTLTSQKVFMKPEKRQLGLIFQDNAVFPHLSVKDNILFGIRKQKNKIDKLNQLLELFGLNGQEVKMPYQLSGGQLQRVAIARALAPEPSLLLMDEPFSNLDALLRRELRAEMKTILKNAGISCILVTHDQEEAFSWSDKVAVMRRGEFLQLDAPEKVYLKPVSKEVASFVGETDFIPGTAADGIVNCVLGRLKTDDTKISGKVEVMMRPENIEIKADKKGNAKVTERIFCGDRSLLNILIDYYNIKVEVPSRIIIDFEIGDRVTLNYPYHCVIFPLKN